MLKPPSLNKGDKIGLVAPARKIKFKEISKAIDVIEKHGFVPVYNDELFAEDHQFSGSDQLRGLKVQQMLDDPAIKAIFSVRGGYGSVRIIDLLDFTRFKAQPKWFVGYSDVTVFHCHINHVHGVQSLHASMPINFSQNTEKALCGLFQALKGGSLGYTFESNRLNRPGSAEGLLCGGNLSVLYSLMGSHSFPDFEGKILFLEDLDEYLYHIDRMMLGLKRAGYLSKLKGLIVGSMSEMNDNEVPFGKTAYQIINEAVAAFDYPVCFGFPAGHIDDNRPLIMGANVKLDVKDNSQLIFLD